MGKGDIRCAFDLEDDLRCIEFYNLVGGQRYGG